MSDARKKQKLVLFILSGTLQFIASALVVFYFWDSREEKKHGLLRSASVMVLISFLPPVFHMVCSLTMDQFVITLGFLASALLAIGAFKPENIDAVKFGGLLAFFTVLLAVIHWMVDYRPNKIWGADSNEQKQSFLTKFIPETIALFAFISALLFVVECFHDDCRDCGKIGSLLALLSLVLLGLVPLTQEKSVLDNYAAVDSGF